MSAALLSRPFPRHLRGSSCAVNWSCPSAPRRPRDIDRYIRVRVAHPHAADPWLDKRQPRRVVSAWQVVK
jgi:hypothetical protein